ncbi:formate dehydrogenase subunit gamma [Chloroflexota bacterium]
MQKEVERFTLPARWFHWVHTTAFLVLGITGLFLFIPWFGDAAIAGVSRLAHRVAAVIFMAAPLIFLLANWRKSWSFVKEAFVWGKEDIEWLKAAPDYYFGGDPSRMPPQGYHNTGQKLWWLTVLVSGVVFVVTGIIMWLFKGIVAPGVFQWCVFAHDVTFITAGCFFLVHFYLSVLHPRMPESLPSMILGKVSRAYARSHHGKWYEEVSRGQRT